MSVLVMGHCFKIKFGSPQLKAVAVALADHAHDDGTKIWPSVRALAEKTELSERTVQYKLRELEACGLVVLVEEGGHGPKDTREYKFEMKMLRGLSDGELELREEKGATDAPFKTLRVHPVQLRVQATTDKGAPGAPEPSLNHQEPKRAHARAKGEFPDLKNGSEPKPVRPAIDLTPADASWQDWLSHIEARGHEALAQRAKEAGLMQVPARWPERAPPDALPNVPKPPKSFTDRMLGETAA